jgi:hypothetical protein
VAADNDILSSLVKSVGIALQPLGDAAANLEDFTSFLDEIGCDPNEQLTPLQLSDLQSSLSEAIGPLTHPTDLRTVVSGLNAFVDLFRTKLPQDLGELPGRALDALIVNQLQREAPRANALLMFFGLVEFEKLPPSKITGRPRSRSIIHWDRIPQVLTDATTIFQSTYGWGMPGFDPGELLRNLRTLLMLSGVPAAFQSADESAAMQLNPIAYPILRVPLLVYEQSDVVSEFGLAILPTRDASDTRFDGLVLVPTAIADLSAGVELQNDWTFRARVNAGGTGAFGLILRDDGTVALRTIAGSASDQAMTLDLAAGVEKASADGPTILFGAPGTSRLEVDSIRVQAIAQGTSTGQVELGLETAVSGGRLIVSTTEGDSFLSKILPAGGLEAPFDLTLGWSTGRGVYFGGSASLELVAAIHVPLGPVLLSAIRIRVAASTAPSALGIQLAVDAAAEIGPITASITAVGVGIDVVLSRTPDFSLRFIAPSGAGVAVDTGGIRGGGFLTHNDANGQYAGILDLKFTDIGLVGVGIITTKLPGGRSGYALFVNIGVTFTPPLELPYNLSLVACGGLLAVNRTMDIEALRSGLRNKTLDSILFPEDPILNANKIITDSETVFPIHEGRFIIGPMVKLGWLGNVVIADIAVVIELPSPIMIAILGQITAALPEKSLAKIVINLDVLGVVDIAKKSLAIDATLYDSKIVQYDLSGDSALRLTWGSNPVFALALGGFHPKFDPPPNFPSLRRLTLQMRSQSDFELSCTVYNALTSNTLQLGARLQLHAEACGAALDGHISMDTLITWSPFEFEVDIDGGVSASFHGHDIASVHLSVDLSGPTPWHAKGKAKVSVLCWDVTAHFSKTWGEDDRPSSPAIDPHDLFIADLKVDGNWGSGVLPRRAFVESLKSLDAPSDPCDPNDPTVLPPIYAHPACALEVRQHVVPLRLDLEKFGNADVTGHTIFDIALVLGLNPPPPDDPSYNVEDALDFFARGQFKDLSKSERLSKPSYEQFKAGTRIGPKLATLNGGVQPCDLKYESILIPPDGVDPQPKKTDADARWSTLGRAIGIPALRWAGIRNRGLGKFNAGLPPRVQVETEAYAIVNKDTLIRDNAALPATAPNLNQTLAEDHASTATKNGSVTPGSVAIVPEYEEAIA